MTNAETPLLQRPQSSDPISHGITTQHDDDYPQCSNTNTISSSLINNNTPLSRPSLKKNRDTFSVPHPRPSLLSPQDQQLRFPFLPSQQHGSNNTLGKPTLENKRKYSITTTTTTKSLSSSTLLEINLLAGRPSALYQALISAAKRDDVEVLETILRLSGGIGLFDNNNRCNSKKQQQEQLENYSALWHAASCGSDRCVALLAKYGMDPNGGYCEGGTPPLLIAAAMNHTSTISLLLSPPLSVSPNTTNAHGTTAATLAAHGGYTALLRVLQSHGADMNKANDRGRTPAMIAAREGRVEVLMFLREECKGVVDFRMRDEEGMDCVAIACVNDEPFIIEYLSSISTPDDPLSPTFNQSSNPPHNDKPLHIAIRHSKIAVLEALLSIAISQPHLIPLQSINNDNLTPLQLAIQIDNIDAVKTFCHHAKTNDAIREIINIKDDKDRTPLYHATIEKRYDLARILAPFSDPTIACTGSDADGHHYHNHERPPLIAAVEQNDIIMVSLLLSATYHHNHPNNNNTPETAPIVDLVDERGHTGISIAAKNGYKEICEVLVKHGADLNLRSKKGGTTPLQKAKKYKHVEIVEFLTRVSKEREEMMMKKKEVVGELLDGDDEEGGV